MNTERQRRDRRPVTGTPRWVKALGVVAAILLLLFVILHLTGNDMGDHGASTRDAILALRSPNR